MPVKNINDINTESIQNAKNTFRQILIGPDEGPNFAMRRFTINPGGKMPMHTNSVEHEQYVLNGKAKIGIGNKQYEVKKNDIVFIPANIPHFYEVMENEPFVFLCIVPNKPDQIKLIDTNDGG
jgi:quercetin dioxygenase-like cupin family protein